MAAVSTAHGQGSAEWLTSSGDAARDGWQRTESKITPKNAGKMQLLWKSKLDSKPMGMLTFREPLIVAGVKTATGTQTLAILAWGQERYSRARCHHGKSGVGDEPEVDL